MEDGDSFSPKNQVDKKISHKRFMAQMMLIIHLQCRTEEQYCINVSSVRNLFTTFQQVNLLKILTGLFDQCSTSKKQFITAEYSMSSLLCVICDE